MALDVESREAHELAKQLSEMTGQSMTPSVVEALREAVARRAPRALLAPFDADQAERAHAGFARTDVGVGVAAARAPRPWALRRRHPEQRPDADAAVTETPTQSVWVASADCTPVLIGDRITGRTAAIHSGWRGTALGIVPETVAQMVAMGSQLADLRFALGPAIAGEVYQVTTHVGAEVAASLNRCDGLAPDDAIALLLAEPEPALLPDPQAGRVRLDVRQIIRRQLIDLDIPAEHAAIAPCCTYQQPDLFFSYRRTREKQVQWSGIVSTAP